MTEEDLKQEAQDAATEEPIDMREYANNLLGGPRRHPGDFYGDRPSDEQMSYFVRGGR